MKNGTWKGLGALLLAAGVVAVAPSAATAAEEAVPTFTKDVAPIFQAKCEACHRPGSIAPMSLVTYQESRPWARSIRERVETRQMPPWHIDRTVGIQAFQNDRSLTDAEIDTVVRWVDGGAPRGNPADMPAPVDWPDESKWYFAERFDGPARSRHRVGALHHAGRGQRRVVEAAVADGADRGPLGAGHRDPPEDGGGPQDHPPRHRPARAGGDRPGDSPGQRRRRLRPVAHRRHLHGVGGRQAGRDHAPRRRQAHAGRLRDPVGHPLLGGRRGDYRQRPARRLPLSEGPDPRAPAGAAHHGGRRRGHPAQQHLRDRGLLPAAARRPRRELPAAHAPAREGDVDGGDPSERAAPAAEPRGRLQLQLAQHLRLRRRRGAAAAPGHDDQGDRVARQHLG